MRIIGGALKNKKLNYIKNINTRPLRDYVRENVFNILEHSKKMNVILKDSIVFDLFSGVGSFGLECLSRGSKKTIFVENDKNAINILNENIDNLRLINKYFIEENDVIKFLENHSLNLKANIVFLDPPYKENRIKKILSGLINSSLINTKTLIIIHREKNSNDSELQNFVVVKIKYYGRSKIIFGNLSF